VNLLYILLLPVALLLWFIADMNYSLRRSKRRAELEARGDWNALNVAFEKALKCRRPMLLLFERFATPGHLEARYASHLSKQGDEDRALSLVDRALAKAIRPARAFIRLTCITRGAEPLGSRRATL
jgi:hypothetical protein